jgi:hypothetical protein
LGDGERLAAEKAATDARSATEARMVELAQYIVQWPDGAEVHGKELAALVIKTFGGKP